MQMTSVRPTTVKAVKASNRLGNFETGLANFTAAQDDQTTPRGSRYAADAVSPDGGLRLGGA